MPHKVILLLLFSLGMVRASDFFVAPKGNDEASGKDPQNAWRSISRVNRHIAQHSLTPGDRIQFQGGSEFTGNLVLTNAGGGSKSNPVVIATYGQGRATVRCGTGTGILVRETPWVTVSNLVLKADAAGDGDGIKFDRTRTTAPRIPGVTIRNCTIQGFAWHGIMIDASQCLNGYEQVLVEDCETSANRYAGIMIYGGNPMGRTHYPHAGVSVLRCAAYNNLGDPDQLQQHSGSGIMIDGVRGALVRECVASGNGAECRNGRGGPVGIWAHASRDVIIERCESFGNRTMLRDGAGFDLDGGCEDSVMRWNWSHDNDGAGIMVYTYAGAPYSDRGCKVIGNISWNDGRKGSGYAGIEIGSEEGCRITDLEVAFNTVIAPPQSVTAFRILGHNIAANIRSNLVITPAHGVLVAISGFGHRMKFSGNRYWRDDAQPVFLIDNHWAIPSLDSWKNSTGPDFRFVAEGDRFVNPHFSGRLPVDIMSRQGKPRWPKFSMGLEEPIGASPLREK